MSSRGPRLGQSVTVQLGGEDYEGHVVEVTEDHVVVAIEVSHDPADVLPAQGSVTWKGKRPQAFGHGEMTCLTTVRVTLPRSKPRPVRLDRRLAVDLRDASDSTTGLLATGFTCEVTGDRALLELNHPVPPGLSVEIALYFPRDLLALPATVESSAPEGEIQHVVVRFDPASEARGKLTRLIFAHLRSEKR